jgi:GGDEF domain-containing protein
MIQKLDRKDFFENLNIKEIMESRKNDSFDSYILTKSSYIFIDLNRIMVLNDEFGHYKIDDYLEFFEKELEITVLNSLNEVYWSRMGGNQYIIFGLFDNFNYDINLSLKNLNDKLEQFISLLYLNKKQSNEEILHLQKNNIFGFSSVIVSNIKEDKTLEFETYTDTTKIFNILDVFMYNLKSTRNSKYFEIDFNLLEDIKKII